MTHYKRVYSKCKFCGMRSLFADPVTYVPIVTHCCATVTTHFLTVCTYKLHRGQKARSGLPVVDRLSRPDLAEEYVPDEGVGNHGDHEHKSQWDSLEEGLANCDGKVLQDTLEGGWERVCRCMHC